MRQRSSGSSKFSSEASNSAGNKQESDVSEDPRVRIRLQGPKRSSYVILTLFLLVIYNSWSVHRYQFENLPAPLTADEAGKRGFSEVEAMKHVHALTELGPHPVGSDALHLAVQYVMMAAEKIKKHILLGG